MISFSIMHAAHATDREPLVKKLIALTDARVVVDTDKRGIWHTAKRAWSTIGLGCTHHMVLQDDFAVCDDFVELVSASIKEHPDAAISFFQPPLPGIRRQYIAAHIQGKQYINTPLGAIQWGGTTILPIARVNQFLDWCNSWEDHFAQYFGDADDERLGMWLNLSGIEKLHYVPELMRHLGHQSSLVGHNDLTNDWRYGCFYIDDVRRNLL